MFPERYDVSNDVKKIAVYFVRNTIKKSYENINSALISKDINISIDNFKFLIGKETNIEDINKEIDRYINTNYRINDKLFWILLLVINLVGVVSVFLVLSMQIMVVIIILLLIIGNITLFYKTYQEYKALQEEKEVESKNLKSVCDVIYAEIVDYRNTIKNNGMEYKKLQAYLDGIDVNSFISTNNDRKLDLGD